MDITAEVARPEVRAPRAAPQRKSTCTLASMSLVISGEVRAAGAHEQQRLAHAPANRRLARLEAQQGHGQPQWKGESLLAGEVWVGRPAMPMAVPPRFRTRSDLASVSPPWESRTTR